MLALLPIMAALKRFGGFLMRLNPWQLALIALALFALVQHFEIVSAHRHSRKVEAQLHECTQGRLADRATYQQAQADAAQQNRADVTRIETQQQKVTTDVETDYQRQLAALRHELRSPGDSAPQGHLRPPGIPQVPNATADPDGQAVPLPSDDVLRAAETELQLNALISWVEQQEHVSK